ncbi:hypothetical protein RvY_13662 [Ramazzottius varieornatus]|uniref:sn-1-specific diacylglycerol lipase ABHD11 n=1 Tax=Ramazzottius varieornatus TaxID=947166 RepID=A0A1D1VSQ7_RAMVA|nr:hypothetical protein RvY_13662 [Ramazzottius varieornatus]
MRGLERISFFQCSSCNYSTFSIPTRGSISHSVVTGVRHFRILSRNKSVIPKLFCGLGYFIGGGIADRRSLLEDYLPVWNAAATTRKNSDAVVKATTGHVARLASTSWKPEGSHTSTSEGKRCPVYLMHGLLGFKEEFEQYGQAIADGTGHLVTALDATNHGGSSHTDEISYPSMADDLASYMGEQDVKEAIVVAHSMGAGAAMYLALHQPERVRALFLIDSVIADVPRRAQIGVFMRFMAAMTLPKEGYLEDVHKNLTDLLVQNEIDKFVITQSILPNIIMQDGEARWRVNIDVLAQNIKNLTDVARMPDNTGLTFEKPTYVLIGECSDYVSREKEKLIYKNFPNAKTQRVGNAGHWVHIDQPEIFVEAVIKFVRSLS